MRRLRAALRTRPALHPRVFWRPYLLNPDVGPEGMRQAEFLARAFGNESRVRRFQETVQHAGRSVGIDFRFENADFTPYAPPAHRLLGLLDGDARVLDLADALFTEYFSHGRNLADIDVLAGPAMAFGIDREALEAVIGDNPSDPAPVGAIDDSETHRLGINGVPSFVLEGGHVISGAHDDVVLTRMIDVAAAGVAPRTDGEPSVSASST